jgi:peptide/nickel transport system substrate-binding protein
MLMKRRLVAAAAALCLLTLVLAACTSSSSGAAKGKGSSTPSAALGGAFGAIPAPAAGAQHAGVITWAEPPNTAPTWILPIYTSAADSVSDTDEFSFYMWRPLYWFSNGVEPTETPSMSLAYDPVWSDNDTVATIKMRTNYTWSDGTPVSSADVVFTMDEIKAAIAESAANWGPYSQGSGIPDEVASVAAPTASTVVITMKAPVNPGWFLDDMLAFVDLMPAHAWARASANGPLLNYAIAANAKKIYNFLAAASGSLSTYATNPLWKVVDGPYTLTRFTASTGAFTLTPNPSYGGPHAKTVSTFEAIPYTSDTAEFDAVRSGSVDVGYLPVDDIKQVPLVKAEGYNVFGYPGYFFNYVAYNFADKGADFNNIIAQLYVRQALAHLEDEQGYIDAFMGGAGGQAYGPVPKYPASPYTPSDATTDPYPFSVPDAIALLKSHGWTVNPGSADVCTSAGTGQGECGAGIPAGTKLAFNLVYSTSPAFIEQECTALASEAANAGIDIHLQSSNYNYIITYYDNPTSTGVPYINKWAAEDFGGYVDSTYPTTQGIFNTGGAENEGTYSNPTANSLINSSVTSGNPVAVKAEASFLTLNQPGLFQPDNDWVSVWKTNLSAPEAIWAATTQYYIDAEYMYFTG